MTARKLTAADEKAHGKIYQLKQSIYTVAVTIKLIKTILVSPVVSHVQISYIRRAPSYTPLCHNIIILKSIFHAYMRQWRHINTFPVTISKQEATRGWRNTHPHS